MNKFKAGTVVLLEHRGQYYERFLIGYSSKDLPVVEIPNIGFITVQERRLKAKE